MGEPTQIDFKRPKTPDSQIKTVRIGVSGHRELQDTDRIKKSIVHALSLLDAMHGSQPHRYSVISPLAEGADRLVARCVLDWKGVPGTADLLAPQLEVVVVLPH
jgi:hypothetical protein